MNAPSSSDSWLTTARGLCSMDGQNTLTNRELLALVECAEALKSARCPNSNCDNKGTIMQRVHDWFEPAPCQWCDERDAALAKLEAL